MSTRCNLKWRRSVSVTTLYYTWLCLQSDLYFLICESQSVSVSSSVRNYYCMCWLLVIESIHLALPCPVTICQSVLTKSKSYYHCSHSSCVNTQSTLWHLPHTLAHPSHCLLARLVSIHKPQLWQLFGNYRKFIGKQGLCWPCWPISSSWVIFKNIEKYQKLQNYCNEVFIWKVISLPYQHIITWYRASFVAVMKG